MWGELSFCVRGICGFYGGWFLWLVYVNRFKVIVLWIMEWWGKKGRLIWILYVI